MLLYSSPDLYAVFQPGESDFLLITFGFNGMAADNDNFWGKSVCIQAGWNAVGFMARRSEWFPPSMMKPAIEAVLPHIAGFRRRITHGGSMGGFGAVRYARELGADTTLAYAPQYSIDPEVVGHFDPNFTELFKPELNRGMEPDGRHHVAERAFILFDPLHVKDNAHVQLLREAAPQVTLIPMPHTGHAVASVFGSRVKAVRIVKAALSDDVSAVRAVAAAERRVAPIRAAYLAQAALRRHPGWAAGIVLAHGGSFPLHLLTSIRTALRFRLQAAEQQRRSAPSPALAAFCNLLSQAVRVEFGDSLALLRTARDEVQAGQREQAAATLRKLLSEAPRHADAHFMLAGILLDLKQNDEAAQAARRAAELEADNAIFHLRHAIAEERAGRLIDAVEAARRAVSYAPQDAKLRDILAGMLVRHGRPAEALESTRKAVSLDPNFLPAQMRLSHLAAQVDAHEDALTAAQRVVALGGDKPPTLLTLALRYRALNRLEEAAAVVARGLEIEPDHPGLQNQARQLGSLRSSAVASG